MPSLTPAAAALNDVVERVQAPLQRRHLLVREPLARRQAAPRARPPTARRRRTSPRRTGTAARASSSRSTLCTTFANAASWLSPARRCRPARAPRRGSSHGTSLRRSRRRARSRSGRTAAPRARPRVPKRCMYSGTSSGSRLRPASSIAPVPPLIANAVSQSSGVRWRAERREVAGETCRASPSGCSRSTSMSRC